MSFKEVLLLSFDKSFSFVVVDQYPCLYSRNIKVKDFMKIDDTTESNTILVHWSAAFEYCSF